MFGHTTYEEIKFEIAKNNFRFSKSLKESLKNKTFRQVMAILEKEEHCPIAKISIARSKNNWVKGVIVYGCHSSICLTFDKHSRRVKYVW